MPPRLAVARGLAPGTSFAVPIFPCSRAVWAFSTSRHVALRDAAPTHADIGILATSRFTQGTLFCPAGIRKSSASPLVALAPRGEVNDTNGRIARAGSSAVERWPYKPDVAGSKPVPPTVLSETCERCDRICDETRSAEPSRTRRQGTGAPTETGPNSLRLAHVELRLEVRATVRSLILSCRRRARPST
jgi:hypothetical protein